MLLIRVIAKDYCKRNGWTLSSLGIPCNSMGLNGILHKLIFALNFMDYYSSEFYCCRNRQYLSSWTWIRHRLQLINLWHRWQQLFRILLMSFSLIFHKLMGLSGHWGLRISSSLIFHFKLLVLAMIPRQKIGSIYHIKVPFSLVIFCSQPVITPTTTYVIHSIIYNNVVCFNLGGNMINMFNKQLWWDGNKP